MYTELRRTVQAALYVGLLMAFPLMASAQGYSNPTSGTRGNDMSSGTTSDTGTSTNNSQTTGYGPTTNGYAMVVVAIYLLKTILFPLGFFYLAWYLVRFLWKIDLGLERPAQKLA